jgi:hypothetical protein
MKFATSIIVTRTALFVSHLIILSIVNIPPTHAQENTFSCVSICPDTSQDIINPDQTVTYDWNARIPVPSSTIGETVQTYTCAEFDVRLTTFDESDCAKHQQGLQEAGCTCGSGAVTRIVSLVSTVTTCTILGASVIWLLM